MRIRLFLSFLLIILITTTSLVLIARWQAIVEIRNFVARGGFAGAETLVNALERYYRANQSWDGIALLLSGQGQRPGPGGFSGPGFRLFNERFRLADASGNVIYDSAAPNQTPAQHAPLQEGEIERAIPLRVDRQIVGYVLLDVRAPLTPGIESGLVNLINRGAILAALISALLAIILALILGYILLQPIRTLTRAAAALGQGDLSQRVPVEGDDEIAALAETFNHMAASLQAAEARRQAMTADIAHELRTPLAVQRANLEALQDGVYPLTTDNLQAVYEQTLLLERLVEDLRTLALADAGQLDLILTPTDLPALLKRVADQFTPQASQQRRTLTVQLPPPDACPPMELDPGRVEQILGNLLTNALRHTPEGGLVTVTLACTPEGARLTVRDTGPGIPPEHLPHIFERFYRSDRARSRAEGGSGLGLSIARRIAEAHRGTLTAENHPAGGAIFTLTLPRERR